MSLIITWSQDTTQDEYDHYIKQFETIPQLKKLYEMIEKRIFFLGALPQASKFLDMNVLQNNVFSQRQTLINHIISQNNPYNLKQLAIYQNDISLTRKIVDFFEKIFRNTCQHQWSHQFVQRHNSGITNDEFELVKQNQDTKSEL